MSQNTHLQSVVHEHNALDSLAFALEKQLKIDPKSKRILVNLSQYFELLEFQLGDLLENVAHGSPNLAQQEKPTNSFKKDCKQTQFFFIICQGRVRLLSFDAEKQREVSTGLLTEGKTFGGECLFNEAYLPYKAIAAESKVRVARIPIAKLQPQLANSAQLKEHWFIETRNRQGLIFLKTLTALRSLSSHRLQQLLIYLEEGQIPAGTNLAETNLDRFWLRQGQIHNQSLDIGSSFGYPDPIPNDWVAQTELLVYHLPKQNWESACEIIPLLADVDRSKLPESPHSSLTVTKVFVPPQTKSNLDLANKNGTQSSQLSTTPTEVKSSDYSIDFPQPIKSRPQLWKSYPFMQQQSSSDCGAACLGMISQYYGKRFTINYLRNLAGIGRTGVSLKGLTKAAESIGYQARPVRASLNRLAEQNSPWIAHWQGDHYIVVYWIKGNQILVADPAMGKYKLSRHVFLEGWTGYALLLNPTERLYQTPNKKRSLGQFFGLLWPYRNLAWQIIALSVLIQIFGLISPLFPKLFSIK